MTSTNWSQIAANAAGGGPNLPEGPGYQAKIIKADAVKSGKSGKFKFTWTFQVLTGPHAGKTEVLKQWLSPDSPVALGIFRRVLSDLGIQLSEIPDGTPEAAVANMVVGGTYTFDIKHKANPGYDTEAAFYSLKRVDEVVNVTAPVSGIATAIAAEPSVPVPTEDVAAQLAALQAQVAAQADAPASKRPW